MRKYLIQLKMADDDEEDYDTHIDYKKLRETHETAGYREGLETGEEITLQAGFDEGFAWGTSYGTEWAKLRGILSALLSYISSKDDQNKDEVISQLTELLKEAQKLEETMNMDDLISSPKHTPSKMIKQRNSNQDLTRSAEQECCEESCNRSCRQETEEDKSKVTKQGCGTCCKENPEKPCLSEPQSDTEDKTDMSQVENTETVLPSSTEMQNLLLQCKSIVSQLGLNPETILSPVEHLLRQQVSL